MSLAEIKERCRKIKERLYVDEKDVDRIEKGTVGQSANEKWNQKKKKTWDDLVIKGVKELPDRSLVDTEGVFISTIHFNSEFWSSVLPKLEAFYNEHILVQLAYPRVKYGLPRLNMRDV